MKNYDFYTEKELRKLSSCTLCPHECGVNRLTGAEGYCGTDAGLNVASVCIHRGEEPPVSGPDGICNIFFSGCNLRCTFCQNHEISRHCIGFDGDRYSYSELIAEVDRILSSGIRAVGFVSPSHVIPQVRALIRGIRQSGHDPVFVFNTNSYDKPEIIDEIDSSVDVYLPDYKYVSRETASIYSGAADYPDVALRALKRMYYHKGSSLFLDDKGRAERGILIRHLVLPGHTDESIAVLRSVAEELSTGMNISLMSQYHPAADAKKDRIINRSLADTEYLKVKLALEELGFTRGWLQDPESHLNYRPDFRREHPFETGST
jgi:putative pyruvate formate lyase activating enzyme